MRRLAFTVLAICVINLAFAQAPDTSVTVRKPVSTGKGNDHFLFQLGYTTWLGKPDSINTSGLPRTANIYFMFAFPFKTNPKWSVGIGLGIASDNIYFKRTYIGIKDITPTLVFQDLSDTTHFKKYKLSTTYLEAPVELRFSLRPDENRKSFKVAVGAKVGTMLSAMVKGKNLEDKNGNEVNSFLQKEKSKRFFNTNRLSLTGRIGYGHFSLFTSYAVTPLFKEGVAATINPMTIGLTISGL